MKATITIEDPEDVVATLTIKMKVKEWKELRQQLESAWPSSDLRRTITDLLWQVNKVLYADDEKL